VDNGSASLKAKLAVGQIFLGAILMALNSWVYLSFANWYHSKPHILTNLQCFLDQTWKRSARWFCVSQIFSGMSETRTTLLAACSSKLEDNGSGSFWGGRSRYRSCFVRPGRYHLFAFSYLSGHLSQQVRSLTISSMGTVKIAQEFVT
jgi:hypothetical protein